MSANSASTETIILSEDFFGVAFAPLIESLSATKPERKDAFQSVRVLAKMAGLISGKEKILAVSYGTNISGSRIVILTLARAEAEIPPKDILQEKEAKAFQILQILQSYFPSLPSSDAAKLKDHLLTVL